MNDEIRSDGEIREVTPGKFMSKKLGTDMGSSSSMLKCLEGKKSVQVKDPS